MLNLPPNMRILLKCVSGAAENLEEFQNLGHTLVGYAYFLLHICVIHAISST